MGTLDAGPPARPLVSIVITAYNYGRYLPRSVESALAQRYSPLEVLVMDNASTDETAQVLERYASDPRFRVVRNERNVGLTPNHNLGLAHARGDYLIFVSADDELVGDAVKRAMGYYDTHPGIDVVYGWAYRMNEAGRENGLYRWAGLPLAAYDGGRNELANSLAFGGHKFLPTMMIRRSVWDRHGGFDESFVSADWELEARWAAGGVRFGLMAEPLAFVRDHGQNASKAASASGIEMRDAARIFERYLQLETADRFAGYEMALTRTFQQRDAYFREQLGPAGIAEVNAITTRLLERVGEIARANAGRKKSRFVYIVLADDAVGALGSTLESIAANDDPGWRAIVVQQPGLTVAPICSRVDAARIRHAHLMFPGSLSDAVNVALSIEDGDIYVVLRAGARVPPSHARMLLQAFAEPGVRLALTWARVLVHSEAPPFGAAFHVAARESPPRNVDLAVTPMLEPESVAFSRSTLDGIGGYPDVGPLSDWAFLVLAALGGGVCWTGEAVETSVWPGMREARLCDPRALASLEDLYRTFPIVDARANAERAAFAAYVRAAHDRGFATAAEVARMYDLPAARA